MQTNEASNRRIEERTKVLWGAEIQIDEYFEPLACTVRNISDNGARLQLAENVRLPEAFRLWVASRHLNARVSVKWRDGRSLGVRIEGIEAPRSLSEPCVPPPVGRRSGLKG